MKLYLIFSLLIFSFDLLKSQCTPASMDYCEDANTLCSLDELNGYTCHNPEYNNPTGCSPLCPTGGGAHNTAWWSFVTEGGKVCLTISFSNCSVNGNGVQLGIWDDCSCGGSIACEPSCTGIGQKTVCADIKPCKIYYLFVDGCSGDVCDFTINTTGGANPKNPNITGIIGELNPCFNQCTSYNVLIDNPNCEASYEWTIDGSTVSYEKTAMVGWIEDGEFVLCVTAIIGNPTSGSICASSQPYCVLIKVEPENVVVARDEMVCDFMFPFHWGDCIINKPGEARCRFYKNNCCYVDSIKKFILVPDDMPPCDEKPYIKGRVFFDMDKNYIFSPGDKPIDYHLVYVNNSKFSSFTVLGDYTLELPKNSNNEIIAYNFDKKYYKIFPASHQVQSTNVPSQIPGNYDFAVQFIEATDLEISVIGRLARPGGKTTATIEVRNLAPKGFGDSDINLIFPSTWTFNGSSNGSFSLNQNSLTWTIKTPDYGQKIKITADFTLSIQEILGTTYKYEASINNNYDINLVNNKAIFCDIIRNSFDPNDKLVNYEFIPESYTDKHHEITYTIRFQNVGNDVAYNIFILDTLHKFLDPLSLRFKSSSHTCQMIMNRLGFIRLEFNNINLPDTSVSQVESQGYVQYSVRPKNGVENGSIITNRADIYFDKNPGIITNQVSTKVIVTEVSDYSKEGKIKIYPNPVSDELIVSLPTEINSNYQLEIVNLYGKSILIDNEMRSSLAKINVKSIPNGVYILNIMKEGVKMEGIRFVKY